MTHAAQVSFYLDPRGRQPNELLRAWPTLVDVADSARQAGARVSVIQACARTEALSQRGVDYYFLAPEGTSGGISDSESLRTLLQNLRPDVLHVHGLAVADEVSALARIAGGIPILVQDHASRPPRFWRRRAWRKGLSAAAAVSFCAVEQAAPFQQARLFSERAEIHAIPESTSRFSPGDQAAARLAMGLSGDPCLLWVGHLDANKDPLTVLEGVSQAAERLPDLQLWCYFGTAPLLAVVQRRIRQDSRIAGRVHLMGSVAHAQIEHAMRAADLFVLGSHREGSGYSLLEAMACGLPPVVSDIPSFRSLTGNGTVGKLWPRNDARQLAEALVSIWRLPKSALRQSVRAHFDRELSFEAVGQKLLAVYQRMIQRNTLHASAR